ncbi:MAG: DUF2752 domain-containing protein [Bacteroidetes bacterium]|nr:DUF2752 domain-containing protein [Bacteroidota bacterium]
MKWILLTSKFSPADRRIKIFLAAVFLGVILFPFLISPAPAAIITCKFHQITGHSCPTCGMTRSLVALTHFHLKGAFQYHLFGPLVYIIFLVSFIALLTEIITGRKIGLGIKPFTIRIAIGIFFSLWIIFWIGRLVSEFTI